MNRFVQGVFVLVIGAVCGVVVREAAYSPEPVLVHRAPGNDPAVRFGTDPEVRRLAEEARQTREALYLRERVCRDLVSWVDIRDEFAAGMVDARLDPAWRMYCASKCVLVTALIRRLGGADRTPTNQVTEIAGGLLSGVAAAAK